MSIKILGINCVSHDASAALLVDGEVKAAIEEERYNRKKHTTDFPENAIQFCLEHEGVATLDYVGIPLNPTKSMGRTFRRLVENIPESEKEIQVALNYYSKLFGNLQRVHQLPVSKTNIVYTGHHTSHLADAFFISPFSEAAIISSDGSGDDVSVVMAYGKDNHIDIIKEIQMPNSIGYFYSTITQFLGFKPIWDEGKVMGLAPYGHANPIFSLDDLILAQDGTFQMNFEYFNYHHDFSSMYTDKLAEKLGGPRKSKTEIEKRHEDIAFMLQKRTEEIVFALLVHLYKQTGSKNLCISGGVGLNSVLNGKITHETPFENLYVPATPSDTGTSIGSALWIYHQLLGNERQFSFTTPYLGPEYTNEQIGVVLREKGVPYQFLENPEKAAAQFIADGKIIGWFQGRTEIGARALGNRSILADPRDPSMKDRLNYRVKHREGFRPYAPSILAEHQTEYFEKSSPTFFMSEIYMIRDSKRHEIPAVVHVDGSGRLQTVTQELNPKFYRLISEFKSLTGIPVIVNTSFNIMGEPIVNNPQHALDCFLNTGMDALFMGNYLTTKNVDLK